MPQKKDIETCKEELHGCLVTTVHVRTKWAAEELNKAIGDYITIATGKLLNELDTIDNVGECLAEVLGRLLQPCYHGKLCVVGIGNRNIPADALGPEVIHNLPLKVLSEIGIEGNFRDVCSIEPGTLSTNNIYTEAVVSGVVKETGADCLLLVDSLLSKETTRLFRTIQLSTNGGLSPHLTGRKADWSSLGIPVISLGVPVAIPLSEISPDQDLADELFTSTNIQDIIAAAGRIIAYAILRVCWPSRSKTECLILSELNRSPISLSLILEEQREKAGTV